MRKRLVLLCLLLAACASAPLPGTKDLSTYQLRQMATRARLNCGDACSVMPASEYCYAQIECDRRNELIDLDRHRALRELARRREPVRGFGARRQPEPEVDRRNPGEVTRDAQ